MEDPPRQIRAVIMAILSGSPSVQHRAIERYFAPDAALEHPFVRVSPSYFPTESRRLILAVYRYYKIQSPKVRAQVLDCVWSADKQRLYLEVQQQIHFWYPWYTVNTRLFMVLDLRPVKIHLARKKDGEPVATRWLIAKQTDFYQPSEALSHWPVIGNLLSMLYKMVITAIPYYQIFIVGFLSWIGLFIRAATGIEGDEDEGLDTLHDKELDFGDKFGGT